MEEEKQIEKPAEKAVLAPVQMAPVPMPMPTIPEEPLQKAPKPEAPQTQALAEKWAQVQQESGMVAAAGALITSAKDDEDDDEAADKEDAKNELTESMRQTLAHFKRPKKIVQINRHPQIETARRSLPIIMEEQELMDAIENNPVTLVSGETGSGKSTQIPQFLYERGYASADSTNPGKIGITQPRRIAAIALSKRVAQELNLPHGKEVGYQIRYDSAFVTPSTKIKV